MTDIEKVELLPCPFCGIESQILRDHISPYAVAYTPECMNPKCNATMGNFCTKVEAILAWNTRKNAQTLVPLSKEELYKISDNWISLAVFIDELCAKFGNPKVPSVEDIRDVIKNEYRDDLELAINIHNLLTKGRE